MQALVERIQAQAIHMGNGIVQVDSFLNHQIDPGLMAAMGSEMAQRCDTAGITGLTRVVTAEVSGIAPALATAQALGVPMVFARKQRPITMREPYYVAQTPSHTKGGLVSLMIAAPYLLATDRVLLIDDVLATGATLAALAELVRQSGARLCGMGSVIEKRFAPGRHRLSALHIPILTLATIDLVDNVIRVT
jgi:xanthine phosphoribosyltransferase